MSYTASPPSVISHAEDAARWVAVAIDEAHGDPPAGPCAIADAIAHLLVLCVSADLAYDVTRLRDDGEWFPRLGLHCSACTAACAKAPDIGSDDREA